ncbi:MAG: septum formation initiator family protein [Desulfobacteraceae bacterium]
MEVSQYKETAKRAALPVVSVILILFLLLIVFARNGILDLSKKKAELQESVAKNDELKEENKILYREVNRLKNDEEYIEQVARKELGMIKKNEIIVKFHSDKDEDQPDTAEEQPEKVEEQPGIVEDQPDKTKEQ